MLLLDQWLKSVDFDPAEKVAEVTKIYDQIGIPDLAKNKMNEYFSKGISALEELEGIESRKKALKSFVLALINREH